MAGANSDPIYSKVGAIDGGNILLTAANDFNGQSVNNQVIFTADSTNGSYIQRLRFKPLGGTVTASVARIYINNGLGRFASIAGTMAAITPTGTQSTTGGAVTTGPGITWYAKVYPVDAQGQIGIASLEATAAATTASATGSIAWAWTAVNAAKTYILITGTATGAERHMFTATTNSYTQTVDVSTARENPGSLAGGNNAYYGDISLPICTASAVAGTPEFDYPMNMALPPGFRIIVGLGTTVTAGWSCTVIGGSY
jgi:hypothetical protein